MPDRYASGVVLAGGRSRRMGRDKLPLTVDGVPILRRTYDSLSVACGEVIAVLSGSGDPPGLPGEARTARDLRPGGAGPLAGIEAGLYHVRSPRAFVAAGDMPFLSAGLVAGMLRRLRVSEVDAVVPRVGGRLEPLCAAYSREALGYVSRALDEGVRAVRDLIEALPRVEEVAEEELLRFGEPRLLLMNVNSPEDLAHARQRAQGG